MQRPGARDVDRDLSQGLIITVLRSGEQLLAHLERPQALELRDYLVEAFPLEAAAPERGQG